MKRRSRDRRYLLTSESVTEGHPDKMADKISDSILDELIRQDSHSRVACETILTNGLALVAGEVTSEGYVDVNEVVRGTIADIGYTKAEYGFEAESCGVMTALHSQSPDIAQGVEKEVQGAGDQGIMFGYASDETEEMMPKPIVLAHKLSKRLAEVRKKDQLPYLRPDGKSQVTLEYEGDIAKRAKDVVIAAQHDPDVDEMKLKEEIKREVIEPICGDLLDEDTSYNINETGRFVLGGPQADTGLTGRKIIVDTYGGHGSHGGGCFSGKDPSKVDRSGAYMARYVAKNLVAAGLAEKCEIQLSYAIGVPEPTSILVNTYGTNNIPEKEIEDIARERFPLKPASIIDHLDLLRPIYEKTAAYGHFGRDDPEFTWEKTDMAKKL
ncbi:MAG: methionine adenosyltransferase [Candidatus Thermoplasmatota archaeon]|nr:methionine adenosyltransferase [Candidatus Thermoplasmatota archaeon]MBS3789877.1 methionine adenosyltransferase [Candidatus Thermoplasmatota archaeon]